MGLYSKINGKLNILKLEIKSWLNQEQNMSFGQVTKVVYLKWYQLLVINDVFI